MLRDAKYPIGTQFKTRHKVPRLCKVVDILKTYNAANELVSIRYVAVHEFLGQMVKDSDVVETTITMGLIDQTAVSTEIRYCGKVEPHKIDNDCIPF